MTKAGVLVVGLVIAALTIVSANAPARADRRVVEDRIVVTFPDAMADEERDAILVSVTNADTAIRERFRLAKRDYAIVIVAHQAGGLSEGWRSSITIPTSFLSAWGHGVIWHEITHTYTARPHDFLARGTYRLPHFYIEGLAVWVENRLGPSQLNLHEIVSGRGWHSRFPVTRTILEFDYDNERGTRSMHYAIAGSFVQFLIEEKLGGNLARFQAFYSGHQNDYEKHFGHSFERLADDWLTFVTKMAGS